MKNLIIIILVLALSCSKLISQSTFSLKEAIAYAMENNPDVANAKLAIEDAEAQVTGYLSIGLPKVSADLEYIYYPQVPQVPLPDAFAIAFGLPEDESNEVSFLSRNNFTAGIRANSLLFDGSYFTGLRAARLFKEMTQLQLYSAERVVANNVMDAYLPSLLIHESEKILDKNIENLAKVLFETKEIYKAGFAEQLDVDRLELSLANLKTEKDALTQQKEVAINGLKFLLNFPMEEELILEDNIESLLSDANNNVEGEINYYSRPEYKVAETGLALSELNVERFERGAWPKLEAFGAYQYQYQGDDFNQGFWAPTFLLGAKLSVPIFDGFERRANIDQAAIALKQNENNKKTLESLITLEVTNARKMYLIAIDKLESQNKNLALAQKIYDTTLIKYKEGVGSSLEVTQSEQSLYTTQQNRIQAMFDVLTTKVALDQAMGQK